MVVLIQEAKHYMKEYMIPQETNLQTVKSFLTYVLFCHHTLIPLH